MTLTSPSGIPDSHETPGEVNLAGTRLAFLATAVAVGSLLIARAPVGEIASATLAVVASMALPVATAGLLRRRSSWPAGPELALRFAIGSLVTVVLAAVLSSTGYFTVSRVALSVIALALLAGIDAAWRLLRHPSSERLRPALVVRTWTPAVVAASGPVLAVAYWRSRSAFPYQSTWDGLLHAGIVNRMLDHDAFSLSLGHLSKSFSFDPYLPVFHLNTAVSSRVTGVPVLHELWVGPFVWCALAAVGTFVLVRTTWRDTPAAVAATFVSGLMLTTRKSTNPLLNTLPASDVIALAPLVLLLLTDQDRTRAVRRGVVLSVLLIAVHGLMGMLLLGLVLTCWVVDLVWRRAGQRHRWPAAVLALVGVFVAVVFGLAARLELHAPTAVLDPTSFYGSLTPTVGPQARLHLVAAAYPAGIPGVLVAAAVAAFLWRRDDSATMARPLPMVIWLGFATPVVGLERLEGFLWLGSCLALAWLVSELSRLLRRHVTGRPRLLNGAVTVVVTLALLPLMIGPLRSFRDFQRVDTSEHGLQSSFAPYERSLLPRLARTFGTDLPVVSDPMTQQIAEGLGGFESVGGVSTPASTQLLIARTLVAKRWPVARRQLSALQRRFGPFLLVVTGRSEHWAALYQRSIDAGMRPDQLTFNATFRPWDFSDLPDGPVRVRKRGLLRPIRHSGCVTQQANQRELVLFAIDCSP